MLRSTVRRIQFKINPKHTLSHVFNYTQYCLKVKLVVNQSSWLDKISNPYTALHQLHKKAFDPWRSQFNVHGVYFLETCFLTKPSKGIMLKNQHIWFSKWSFLPSPLLVPITRRFHRRQIIDMSQCVTRFGEHSLLSVISAPCLKWIESETTT